MNNELTDLIAYCDATHVLLLKNTSKQLKLKPTHTYEDERSFKWSQLSRTTNPYIIQIQGKSKQYNIDVRYNNQDFKEDSRILWKLLDEKVPDTYPPDTLTEKYQEASKLYTENLFKNKATFNCALTREGS
mgnify:CR=1 FL=1